MSRDDYDELFSPDEFWDEDEEQEEFDDDDRYYWTEPKPWTPFRADM